MIESSWAHRMRGGRANERERHWSAFKLLPLMLGLVGPWAPGMVRAQPRISGRILNDLTGFGMVGIDLDVFDAQGKPVKVSGATSGANGTYTITLPAAGTYTVRADPSRIDGFADQFYNNVFFKSAATPITVGPNTTVTGIDFRLRPGVEISGTVTAGGTPLANVDLDLYGSNGEFLSGYPARTAANGTYAIGALPPGTYFLRVDPDPALGQFYVLSYYNGGSNLLSATPIVVSNTSVSGIDFALAPGGSVSGTVTDETTGQPLVGLDLDVFDPNGMRLPYNAVTDTNGHYYMGPMPPGQYYLRMDPSIAQGYARVYYPSNFILKQATPVTVTLGRDTPGYDFRLPRAGAISGHLTDLTTGQPAVGIDLDVFEAAGALLDITATSDTNGFYELGPLPAGVYIVRADPAVSQNLARTYYPAGIFRTLAAPVSVTVGQVHAGVDMALPGAGAIAGRVTDAQTGLPLGGVDFDIYDRSTNRLDITTLSASDGTYVLGPLPAGQYFLRADPSPTSGYSERFYPDAPGFNGAGLLPVTAGQTNLGVNLALGPGGWIEGIIQDASGAPVPGIDLDVFDGVTNLRLLPSGRSDINGTFLIGPLAPGAYKVRLDPDPASGYALEYYNQKMTRTNADVIAVQAGAGTPGIAFRLKRSAVLGGRVISDETGLPVAGMDIDVLQADTGWRLDQTMITDSNGLFLIPDIPAGRFLVRTDPDPATQPFVRTYFGQTADPAAATVVVTTPGQLLTNLEIRIFSRKPPSVSLTSPLDGTQVSASPTVHFAAAASDADGTVRQVAFLVDGVEVGVDTTAPFALDWTPPAAGVFNLQAAATDNAGLTTLSAPARITVVQSAPPVVLHIRSDGTNGYVLSFDAQAGRSYVVEFATRLHPPDWQPLQTVTGNNQTVIVTDPKPADSRRFYRVRVP